MADFAITNQTRMNTSFTGEIISLIVAVSWTVTALAAEKASRYASALTMNVVRMCIAIPIFFLLLWITTGSCLPLYANAETWMWLSVAGLVGYVFGDICLFRAYQEMGSRYGQLFMTFAPIFSAIGGYFVFGEALKGVTWIAIILILTGIGMSILGKSPESGSRRHLQLKITPLAALLGIGAAMGQGIGLVISKIGMISYEMSLPAEVGKDSVMMPFAATLIRCLAAIIGFAIIAYFRHEFKEVPKMMKNKKAMIAMTIATVFGPVLGVSLSLLAVLYTSTGIAATLMALVPILILLPSAIFLHQRISAMDIVGAITAVAGVALIFL